MEFCWMSLHLGWTRPKDRASVESLPYFFPSLAPLQPNPQGGTVSFESKGKKSNIAKIRPEFKGWALPTG